jgi:hypothetical protein
MVITQIFLITYVTPQMSFDIDNLCDPQRILKTTYPTVITKKNWSKYINPRGLFTSILGRRCSN